MDTRHKVSLPTPEDFRFVASPAFKLQTGAPSGETIRPDHTIEHKPQPVDTKDYYERWLEPPPPESYTRIVPGSSRADFYNLKYSQ